MLSRVEQVKSFITLGQAVCVCVGGGGQISDPISVC